MNDQVRSTEQSPLTGESGGEEDELPEPDAYEPGEEFPAWFRRILLLCVMLSAIFLIVAYVYPRVGSNTSSSDSSKPLWKQKANEIIEVALERDMERVPELIAYLDSRSEPIRQNAEWALHYMTDLPWATKPEACRKWWNKHGQEVMAGNDPDVTRPEPDRFSRRVSPSDVNLKFFFNLLSSQRVVFSGGTTVVDYELGLVNNNEENTIQLFPPDALPYRAYRYGANIPEKLRKKEGVPQSVAKVPVHLQYGPSVALVYLEWFKPSEPNKPQSREFLEFTVLGRNQDQIKPDRMLGVRKPFPIYAKEDLFSDGPHVLARLTLDGRDLLARIDGEEVRVSLDDISHKVHIFRRNPDDVPGYTDEELARIKSSAREEGYVLQRAERVFAGPFTRNTGVNVDQPISPEERSTENWNTGANKPSAPRTFAGSFSAFRQDTLLYDTKLGWGQIQEECSSCEEQGKKTLHQIRGYIGEVSSPDREQAVIERRSGRRWVLIFRKQSEISPEDGASSGSSK